MKQFRLKFFFCVIAVLITSAGCKKTAIRVVDVPKVTKTDMLVDSWWKLFAQGVDTDNDGTIDLDQTPTFACFLDNLTIFYRLGNGSFDQGPTKCDPDRAQSRLFDWKFINDESAILIDGLEYKILTLTEKDFVVSYGEITTPGTNQFIMVLTH